MAVYCNPLNFNYRYQFNENPEGDIIASREAADPSLIFFKGTYYLFPSMTAGFLHSKDLAHWELFSTKHLPIYDYAPDVRVFGDYIYFCASSFDKGTFYRTKDLFSDEYETFDTGFPFWDPNLFIDEDGRFYFFWGSSTEEPLYGIELDPATMQPLGEKKTLCSINTDTKGYERNGEDHIPSHSPEEMEKILSVIDSQPMPDSMKAAAKNYLLELPYMEGVWVNKHDDTYYLQYGTPSSGHNIYGDGVYVSKNPLGPYTLAKNNPYSYKPGGFLPGAGHGSTMEDASGSLWHTSTMRICINHNFERRIGFWPAGYDSDGELFCNQRYGDWPQEIDELKMNPWADPKWMLLSHGASAAASSTAPSTSVVDKSAAMLGKMDPIITTFDPSNAVDENVQTWWKANESCEETPQWIRIDLKRECQVHAIQINFADDHFSPELPEDFRLNDALMQRRWIDTTSQKTRWLLEGSLDGTTYFVIEDKRNAETDLPHDLIVREDPLTVRYVRLTITELPYDQPPCISGLRIFGTETIPAPASITAPSFRLISPLDLLLTWDTVPDASGYVVNFGFAPDKLYHSRMTFKNTCHIGGLIKDQSLFVRIDAFNGGGITTGSVITIR